MKKKSLIFDASILAENLLASRGRSGIFFATYNILYELIRSDEFNISLYCDTIYSKDFADFVQQNFGKNINIYFGNRYGVFLEKMQFLDVKLRKSKHNILKLLLNLFVRKPVRFIGKFVSLPRFDIAFSPVRIFSKKIKANNKYIILYDATPVLFPEYYPQYQLKKFWFNDLVEYIKTKPNCKYFSISEHTKKDFIKLFDMNRDDIIVTPLAASDNFYHEKDKKKIEKICKKYGIPKNKKYVFSLCTLEPRKNLIRSVKTFIDFIKKNKINDMVFVLGGAHWDEFIGKLEKEIKDLGKYKDKIIRAGYVDDKDLAALYSGAQWFVYTSQYEGFGLPPLEAMKCGTPVITSNNSSLPEVVGDAGIMIDYDSEKQHIAAYEKYYMDEKYRKEMAKKGLAHSKQFSWNATAQIIINQIKGDVNG